uniref:Uncharacterized protein n=1 Tax=Trypanosoma vivax (strain Y486) TaxID=1055687 RepID=G0TRR0_TRYVY|nr:conserved hypothetical protein [Trypanosoma vivax Y486]
MHPHRATKSVKASQTVVLGTKDAESRTLRTGGRRASKQEAHRAAVRLVANEQQRMTSLGGCEARMEVLRDELTLFDRIVQTPAFTADPFAAIDGHLSTVMDFLQPQTPDVGRRTKE